MAMMAGITQLAGAGVGAMGGAMSQQQQMKIANYNATALRQEANQASDAGANNEAGAIRRDTTALGDQAAGFGQANIGTGAGVQAVEKQSATNARMNELNTWYGGELERGSLLNQANFQQWQIDQMKASQKAPIWDFPDWLGEHMGPAGVLASPEKGLSNAGGPKLPTLWSFMNSGGNSQQVAQGVSDIMRPSNYGGGY